MPPDDAARLAALYDAHAAPVWRYVVHLTGDRAGADDIVQETLLRAWRTPKILVEEALATLTTDHRAVVVRAYYRGLSVAEMADELDIPEGTVKSRLHYGLR